MFPLLVILIVGYYLLLLLMSENCGYYRGLHTYRHNYLYTFQEYGSIALSGICDNNVGYYSGGLIIIWFAERDYVFLGGMTPVYTWWLPLNTWRLLCIVFLGTVVEPPQ